MIEKIQGGIFIGGFLICEIIVLGLALWGLIIKDRKDHDIY